MLGFFELTLRSQDPGADSLDAKCNESAATIAAAEHDNTFDPFPARMVMLSLLMLGGWMLFIGFREPTERAVLVSMGLALLGLGVAIEAFIRMHRTQVRSSTN